MSRLLAVVMLGSALALGATSAFAAEPNATLTNIRGNVSVNQGEQFVPATPEMRLSPGDRVMVPDDGAATIAFDDACRLDVTENKMITVPAQSTCAVARVSDGGAVGSTGTGNGGVWAMVAIVAAIDIWWLNEDEDDDDTVSP